MNPQYDDLHSANRMALMTEAAVNLAAAMRIGQQQNQHQQNNQQNSQQQHQVSAYTYVMLCFLLLRNESLDLCRNTFYSKLNDSY